jgi:hypothetical protein
MLGNTSNDGLHEGTLYEVLGANTGTGNATVNATGFNITCRSFPDARITPLTPTWNYADRTVVLDSADKIISIISPTGKTVCNPSDAQVRLTLISIKHNHHFLPRR